MIATELQTLPQPGDVAPDFAARSTSGGKVTLSSCRGTRNLLDKQGIVCWSYVEGHNGFRRSNEEILAEVAKLR